MVLVANSTPIVGRDSRVNSLLLKRDSRLVLPTPESKLASAATSDEHQLEQVIVVLVDEPRHLRFYGKGYILYGVNSSAGSLLLEERVTQKLDNVGPILLLVH